MNLGCCFSSYSLLFLHPPGRWVTPLQMHWWAMFVTFCSKRQVTWPHLTWNIFPTGCCSVVLRLLPWRLKTAKRKYGFSHQRKGNNQVSLVLTIRHVMFEYYSYINNGLNVGIIWTVYSVRKGEAAWATCISVAQWCSPKELSSTISNEAVLCRRKVTTVTPWSVGIALWLVTKKVALLAWQQDTCVRLTRC